METVSVRPSLLGMDNGWIRAGLKKPGKTQAALARAMGLTPQRVQDIVRDKRKVQLAEAASAARYLEVPLPVEGAPQGNDEQLKRLAGVGSLPIRYKVAAGNWVEVDDLYDEPLGYAPIIPRPDIPLEDQWAEMVEGDSCNLLYAEGTILHIRAGWAADVTALHGRRVIVQRRRNGGMLIERTVKEVVVVMSGSSVSRIELVPRSTNPKWKRFTLTDGLRDHEGEDGVTVEIAGLVIGKYEAE